MREWLSYEVRPVERHAPQLGAFGSRATKKRYETASAFAHPGLGDHIFGAFLTVWSLSRLCLTKQPGKNGREGAWERGRVGQHVRTHR
jgi:hypothetical protein